MAPTYMYVIAAEHGRGPCKLGYSHDPDGRLRSLQTGHPERLTVCHREPVDTDRVRLFERLLHRDIGYHRRRGEWFDVSVEAAIAHLQHTVIRYDGVDDLARKLREHRV